MSTRCSQLRSLVNTVGHYNARGPELVPPTQGSIGGRKSISLTPFRSTRSSRSCNRSCRLYQGCASSLGAWSTLRRSNSRESETFPYTQGPSAEVKGDILTSSLRTTRSSRDLHRWLRSRCCNSRSLRIITAIPVVRRDRRRSVRRAIGAALLVICHAR